jgi:hypothetical protein
MAKQFRLNLGVILFLIVASVMMRFVPHMANYSPVLGMALFAGYAFTNKKLAMFVPLAAIFVSDAMLGFYDGISFVYLGYVFAIALGAFLPSRKVVPVMLASIGASVAFFIYSNLGVWLFTNLYAHTWVGLKECFVMALPFLRGTLVSTVVSSAVLFGVYSLFKQTYSAEHGRAVIR